MNLYDTISAISTPSGEGGIAVIRISGDRAFAIIENIFYKDIKKEKKITLSEIPSHTIHFGYLFENEYLVDEVLISVFKNPNSYTGEDIIEVSSHGGILVSQKILSLILKNGARYAEPGEFTKRAFLNKKIDLSQAEAVADLIKSKTDMAHNSSLMQLEGSLSEYVQNVRQDILNVTSLVELELDFAEEDVEFVRKNDLEIKIEEIITRLKQIIESYISGKVIRDGINLVVAGKPNSGKSSLFNLLLKSNRAIVSEISGTTRDYLEENLIIKGIQFNLIDTAGLRTTSDIIESEGIKRSQEKIQDADLTLYLIDSSDDAEKIMESIKYFELNLNSNKTIKIFSKSDVANKQINRLCSDDEIKISIFEEESIERLKDKMVIRISDNGIKFYSKNIILTNLRHKICLDNVVLCLDESLKSIEKGLSGEFISVDLRNALKFLGEITGEITNEDILNNIFLKFCIGK